MTRAILKEAREAAEAAWNQDRHNRNEGLLDLHMLAGDQWDSRDRRLREMDGRPVLTVNRLIQPVKQVTNDIRHAKPQVQVVPVDKDADQKTATVLAGIMRQIQRQSMASWVYAVATGHAAACGIGNFRIKTQYVDDDTFDQELRVELIPHPLAVLWDPAAVRPDRSDANYCLVLEFVPLDQFKRRFPQAKAADFETQGMLANRAGLHWFRPDQVVIAEYWRKVPQERRIGQLSDGRVIDMTNISALPGGMQVVRERKVQSWRVEQSLINGHEELTETTVWPGRYLPIIPVIGNELPLERTSVRHGMVRFARDPQRMYNFWRSTSAEWIGMSPKAPWLAEADQITPYKEIWETANTTPRPFLLYKGDPQNPNRKPTRERPPEPPAALWQEGDITSDEIKATTGIFDASLGARSNEVSGRAINARKLQGEMSNYEYLDNLSISIEHTGRVMLDLVQKIYDTSRVERILDEYEKEHFVPINSVAYTEDRVPVLIHDLTVGKYDVVMKMGRSMATRRQESSEQMVEFLKLNPEAFAAVADIVVEEMDWPGAQKIARRLKRTIPPEILGEDADEPPPPPDPLMIEGVKQEVREKKGQADKKEAEARRAHAQAMREEIGAVLDQLAAMRGGQQR